MQFRINNYVLSLNAFALILVIFLGACTDYEEMYEDEYGYLLDEAKLPYDTMVDERDGQTYKIIKIVSQVWMAENLNFEYKVNGKVFNNYSNPDHPEYGRYYTWAAAMDSAAVFTEDGKGCGYESECTPVTELQGICPEGWHLPAREEFKTLWGAVGGQMSAGIALKFRKKWDGYGDGNNEYGFSALPAGGYYKKTFINVGDNASFWSATSYSKKEAYFMDLHSSSEDANWNYHTKDLAYSVRCLKNVKATSKDKSSSSVKKSSSSVAKSSSSSSAKSSSSKTSVSSSSVKSSSSSVKSSNSSSSNTTKSSSSSAKSSSSVVKSSSSAAKSSSSAASSSSRENTQSSSGKTSWMYLNSAISYGEMTDERDGQVYKTVKIGEQTWMAENLNYEVDGSHCYNDSVKYCSQYGRLYTWAASVGKSESSCGQGNTCSLPSGNIRGLCPDGWLLPSKGDFESLILSSGGPKSGGYVLKSKTGWNGDGNGLDVYGFTALPAGNRYANGSNYGNGGNANFWSTTEISLNESYYMNLGFINDSVSMKKNYKERELSIRCLKASPNNAASSSSATVAEPCKTKTEDNCEYDTLEDSRDGQVYKTVKIGSQWWMAENLNYEADGSYCYNESEDKCAKYGRLYKKTAAETVCPNGWHLPQKSEFEVLITAVGGLSVAAKNLKSTSGWGNNENGVDSYGFSGLPAGEAIFQGVGVEYGSEGVDAYFGVASGSDDALHYMYLYSNDVVGLSRIATMYAFSVRCVKD